MTLPSRHPGQRLRQLIRDPAPRKFKKWFQAWTPAFAGVTLLVSLSSCVHHAVKKTPVIKTMEVVPQPEPGTPTTVKVPLPTPPKLKFESNAQVKIGLRADVEMVGISSNAPMRVTNTDSQKVLTWAAGKHTVTPGEMHGNLKIVPASGHFLESNGKTYRGIFLVRKAGSKVTLINQLGIDDYLRGVLPREVVVNWPLESLKVQAVASRTYLVAHLGRHSSQGFDLCSDVHCQVYGGMGKEHPMCDQAVGQTRGEILTYAGKPAAAYFHSNCGGMTEEVEHVWGLAHEPYLPRVRCPYGTADPRYNWKFDYSLTSMMSLLKAKTQVKGSEMISFHTVKKSPSGRAERVSVKTDEGTYEMSGNEFRVALDPEKIRSTLWTWVRRTSTGYEFQGMGWGHGIGMCQWGAKGQAEHGRTYDEILRFYYPHTNLTQWNH